MSSGDIAQSTVVNRKLNVLHCEILGQRVLAAGLAPRALSSFPRGALGGRLGLKLDAVMIYSFEQL